MQEVPSVRLGSSDVEHSNPRSMPELHRHRVGSTMTDHPEGQVSLVGLLPWCVCGSPATVRVEVQWADRKRRYRYCEECAEDVVFAIEGAEILP